MDKKDRKDPKYPWNNPIVPLNLKSLVNSDTMYAKPSDGKRISKNIWINFREIPPKDQFSGCCKHLLKIFQLAPSWTVNYFDEEKRNEFMERYFKGSAIYWAYHIINPQIGVSKSDIWRYCVLYAFGGFYLDDDADMKTPLDQVSL